MIALLTSARDRELSFQELQRRLGVTGRTLRRFLANERQKANRIRILKRGRVGYATLRQGSGLVARSWDDPVAFEMIEAAFLPTGFRAFVGPSKGLPPATMVLYEGLGDAFKSGFLISTALENAQRGLRTVLVSHEQNLDQLRQLVARRLLGRAPKDSEEARDVCMRTPWLAKNLDLQVVPGTAHVEEFIEDLVQQKSRPEVVVYDYLNQSTMRADHANQQSLLANIVQRLGQGLVDEGIPLITACQLRTEKGAPTAPETWEQRATVVLRVENVRPEDDGRLLAHFLAVRKNKAGYDSHLTKRLKMVVEEASHRILRVEPADEHAIHGQSPQVLAALQPTFSMDELRSLVASRLGKSIADSMVKSLSDELVTGWLALHEIEKVGRDYKKCIPGQGLSDDDDDD